MIKTIYQYRHVVLTKGHMAHDSEDWRFSRKPDRQSGKDAANAGYFFLIATHKVEVPDGTCRARTYSEEIAMNVPGWTIYLDAYQIFRAAGDGAKGLKLISTREANPPQEWIETIQHAIEQED